jgi:hypothetical protein
MGLSPITLTGIKPMTKKLGQRVKILPEGGMREFWDHTGTIIGVEPGRPTMYRVRLDEPVDIPGVGRVRDDLWEGRTLRDIRG